MKFLSHKKIILVGLGVLYFLVIFAAPNEVRAQGFIGDIVGDIADRAAGGAVFPLQLLVMGILFGINALLGLLLAIASHMVVFFINLGVVITKLPAVSNGLDSTIKIANLAFVLAIIVIAFATIFRWENYAAKKMLPRLIIAALLVNFSFLIGEVTII